MSSTKNLLLSFFIFETEAHRSYQLRTITPFKLKTPSYRILIIDYIFFRKNAAIVQKRKKRVLIR